MWYYIKKQERRIRMEKIIQYLKFIQETEQLKSTLRTAWTAEGRQESTAEHSWRLAMLAAVLAEEVPELDMNRVLKMCLVHDLGEVYEGDVSAALQLDDDARHKREEEAVRKIFAMLPEQQERELMELWLEYSSNTSSEAAFVKALDKAETIIQHNQGKNPPDFDYGFNLEYGTDYFKEEPLLQELRKYIDADTRANISKT